MVIFGLRAHADRRAVRYGHSHRAASDAVRRHDDSGFVVVGDGAKSWGGAFPMNLFRAPISVGTFTKGLGLRT